MIQFLINSVNSPYDFPSIFYFELYFSINSLAHVFFSIVSWKVNSKRFNNRIIYQWNFVL